MTLAHLPHPTYPAVIETTVAATPGNQWIELVAPAAELANRILGTEFVPEPMRQNAGAITACILYGAEIGIGPMQSLAKIDIVKGRPAPRAELARALALGAGHEMWVDESTNTKVKVSGRRRGSNQVQSVTWTMEDVKKAGIVNQAYSKYPRQMLLARASAELARMMCPDALGGIGRFAEEYDDADAEPATTPTASVEAPKGNTRRRPTAATNLAPAAQPATEDIPLLPDEQPAAGGPTAEQIKKMMACFNDANIKDRDDRLKFIAAASRQVASSKDLTIAEASTVIDQLEQLNRGDLRVEFNDDSTWTLVVEETQGELIDE